MAAARQAAFALTGDGRRAHRSVRPQLGSCICPFLYDELMVDVETLCLGCMAESVSGSNCPRCGYPAGDERNPIALPERTVLNDRFCIGPVLGKPGGYGITYLAWDLTLQTTAAIKEYLPQRLASRKSGDTEISPVSVDDAAVYKEGLEEFLDEARTLVRFSHPNIVRIRDFFQQKNSTHLVMDYYAGMSLAAYLKQQPSVMSQENAVALISPIFDALGQVQELGYLHRDIKPANIYIADQKTPILLDFGAARHSLGEETESLSVILTPGYAPFEQYFRKGKQGPWTDIYRCAATLYFALSGIRPPPALDRENDDEIEPLNAVNTEVSVAVSDVVMRALSRVPADRSTSAIAFKDAFIQAVSGEPERIEKLPRRQYSLTTLRAALTVWVWRDELSSIAHDNIHPTSSAPPPTAKLDTAPAIAEPELPWRGLGAERAGLAPRPPLESTEACRSSTIGKVCSFNAPHGIER